jgi:hypothetical protein
MLPDDAKHHVIPRTIARAGGIQCRPYIKLCHKLTVGVALHATLGRHTMPPLH